MTENTKDLVQNISFSSDGKKILFDRRKSDGRYGIHVYNLETGELSAYQSPPDETWREPSYSHDGKHIVFIATPHHEKLDLKKDQIAIMDPDGKNIVKITNFPGLKRGPSFSHAGDKVIFGRAEYLRERGRTPAGGYDIFETEVATGKTRRLTEFWFYSVSKPHYLSDDTRFIFSALGPTRFPTIPSSDYVAETKYREELQKTYKENEIFVMREGQAVLKPYMVFYDRSTKPLVSKDGSRLLFQSYGNPETQDGWDQFYLYSPDGKHRRITDLRATAVWSAAVSPGGELLAIVYDVRPHREISRIVIYRVKDGSSREVVLPDQPSRIINQRR
jgi:Tol biopolymer transport system component